MRYILSVIGGTLKLTGRVLSLVGWFLLLVIATALLPWSALIGGALVYTLWTKCYKKREEI